MKTKKNPNSTLTPTRIFTVYFSDLQTEYFVIFKDFSERSRSIVLANEYLKHILAAPTVVYQ